MKIESNAQMWTLTDCPGHTFVILIAIDPIAGVHVQIKCSPTRHILLYNLISMPLLRVDLKINIHERINAICPHPTLGAILGVGVKCPDAPVGQRWKEVDEVVLGTVEEELGRR